MATSTITQLPVSVSIGPTTDYLEIARYTGLPGSLYQAYRVTPQQIANAFKNNIPSGIEYVISNAGSALLMGVQPYFTMPYQCTITAAQLVGSPTGSLTIDIWRTTYNQFDGGMTHPVASDSICGGNLLSISGGTKAVSNLNYWTLGLNQGDILAINIVSAATMTEANLSLFVNRVV